MGLFSSSKSSTSNTYNTENLASDGVGTGRNNVTILTETDQGAVATAGATTSQALNVVNNTANMTAKNTDNLIQGVGDIVGSATQLGSDSMRFSQTALSDNNDFSLNATQAALDSSTAALKESMGAVADVSNDAMRSLSESMRTSSSVLGAMARDSNDTAERIFSDALGVVNKNSNDALVMTENATKGAMEFAADSVRSDATIQTETLAKYGALLGLGITAIFFISRMKRA